MLSEINLSLSALRVKVPGDPLEVDDWQMILSLYGRCDAICKTYLRKELSIIIGVSFERMGDLLVSTEESSSLGQGHLLLMTINQILQENNAMQSKVKACVPAIQNLSMDAKEWSGLMNLLKSAKSSRLTPIVILSALAKTKSMSYADLVSSLSRKQSARVARPIFESTGTLPLHSAKRRRVDIEAQKPAIVSCISIDGSLQHDLVATGARVISSPDPVTPEKGFSSVHKTPGGTKVRSVYANEVGSVFLPLSPEQLTPSRSKGMVLTTRGTKERIQKELPKLALARLDSIYFTATLDKMIARQQVARRISQNTLMKASCREVFAAHGIDTVITSRGSKYHWSHLIAHFLGGEQESENLIPGTAASNYNTLELVEQFIAEKLILGISINIQVTPIYSSESLIPDELKFHLEWDEGGLHYTETLMINPRSYRRESPATLAVVGFFREAARSLALQRTPAPAIDLIP